jgi:hypothetical protein
MPSRLSRLKCASGLREPGRSGRDAAPSRRPVAKCRASNVTPAGILRGNEPPDWRSHACGPMFDTVNRRIVRPLIYVLVATQLLLSAPIATAMASAVGTSAADMPCADSMPAPDDSKPCPCCPDGTTSMAGCLSACTAGAALLPTLGIQFSQVAEMPVIAPASSSFADLADPPLKPPPIV